MRALVLVIAAVVTANIASAESPSFVAVREVVTNAIQECRTAGAEHTLGNVLEALAPEIEALRPISQADRDTLDELRLALDQYKDCL